MRYVIGVCIVTGMLVWDGVYYDGRYLDFVIWSIKSAVDLVIRIAT